MVFCLDQCFQCTSCTHGRLPIVFVGKVMQLDHIDLLDLHTLERGVQLRLGLSRRAVTRLGGQKYFTAMLGQPRCQTQFGLSITGRNVYMVNAIAAHHV